MTDVSMLARCQGRGQDFRKRFPFGFLEPGPHEQCEMVFLSDRIEWFEVHWFEGQHSCCVLAPLICSPCARGIPSIPSGYIGAMNKHTKCRGIIRLTGRMAEEEPRVKTAVSLRGSEFAYWREGNSNKGKKHLRITGHLLNVDKLPGAPDVLKFVFHTIGVKGQTK